MTSDTTTSVQTERAVRAVLDRIYAAWAANDADAFVAPYAEDATALLPGTYLPTRDAIHATMADAFAGPLEGSRGIHDIQSVRFPEAATAIVISRSAIIAAGQTAPAAETRTLDTWVLAQHDGRWRVHAYHNCPEHTA